MLVAVGMPHLPQEIHVRIEQFLRHEAHRTCRIPAHNDIVLRCDVKAIEPSAARIEHTELLVFADLIHEDVPVVAGKRYMITIERDVQLIRKRIRYFFAAAAWSARSSALAALSRLCIA